jgi:hypothetical protein
MSEILAPIELNDDELLAIAGGDTTTGASSSVTITATARVTAGSVGTDNAAFTGTLTSTFTPGVIITIRAASATNGTVNGQVTDTTIGVNGQVTAS